MVSINDNISAEPERPLANMASIMANAGLREAAAALYDAGAATEVPAAMRAQLDLVINDRTAELQKAIDAAVSDIVARSGGNVNDPNIQQAVASLQASRSMPDLAGRLAGAQSDIDRAQNRAQDVNDVETPQQRLDRAWAAFDKADKKLDDAFGKLPLTEEERQEYERLKEAERKAREAYENADTPEEKKLAMQAWQAAAANTSNFVEHTTETMQQTGRATEEQVKPVQRANDSRDEAISDINDAFEAYRQSNHTVESNSSVGKEQASVPLSTPFIPTESFADSNVPAAGDALINQPKNAIVGEAAVDSPTVLSNSPARYEATDIELANAGHLTPASPSQPVVSTGGRTV